MMSESNVSPPMQVTVTNASPQQPTVKTDPGQSPGGLAWLQINIAYFMSIPGILKLIEVVFGIICMACASPAKMDGTHWFLFVVVTSFISTLIWIFLYLFSIRDALRLPINWVLTELVNTAIITVLYFTAFIVQLAIWNRAWVSLVPSYQAANTAAGVFGLFNTIAYGGSTFFLYTDWKGGVTPQQ